MHDQSVDFLFAFPEFSLNSTDVQIEPSLRFMDFFKSLSKTRLLIAVSATAGQLFAASGVTAPIVAEVAAADITVIRVNGEAITQSDIDQMMSVGMQQMQAPGGDVPPEMRSMLLKKAEDNLITHLLVTAAVAQSGIVITDAEIEPTLEKIKGSIQKGSTFEADLAVQGMTLEELKENIKSDMAAQQLLEAQASDVAEASEADAQAFYDSHPEQFTKPANATASHILIKFDDAETDAGKAEKLVLIKALRADILAGKITFEDAARANSGCPSGANGGSLGSFNRGQMVPEFDAAVFSQDLNSVSEIVETSFGYHIIKVTARKEAETTGFVESRDQIIGYLNKQAKQKAAASYIKRLRDSANIERVEQTPGVDAGD